MGAVDLDEFLSDNIQAFDFREKLGIGEIFLIRPDPLGQLHHPLMFSRTNVCMKATWYIKRVCSIVGVYPTESVLASKWGGLFGPEIVLLKKTLP